MKWYLLIFHTLRRMALSSSIHQCFVNFTVGVYEELLRRRYVFAGKFSNGTYTECKFMNEREVTQFFRVISHTEVMANPDVMKEFIRCSFIELASKEHQKPAYTRSHSENFRVLVIRSDTAMTACSHFEQNLKKWFKDGGVSSKLAPVIHTTVSIPSDDMLKSFDMALLLAFTAGARIESDDVNHKKEKLENSGIPHYLVMLRWGDKAQPINFPSKWSSDTVIQLNVSNTDIHLNAYLTVDALSKIKQLVNDST